MRKILFVIGTSWASGYYRLAQACAEMKNHGVSTDYINFQDVAPLELKVLRRNLEGRIEELDMLSYDVITFQLVQHPQLLAVIQRLIAGGVKVIMETDDDYFALPASNPSFIALHPRVELSYDSESDTNMAKVKDKKVNYRMDIFRKALEASSLIQVSTPELKEVYKAFGPTVVLQNCVENHLYNKETKVINKEPVIGWFGTRTHYEDLSIVDGILPNTGCKILIAGWPDILDTGIFKGYKNIEIIGSYKIEQLPKIVRRCDIGIVPLVDHRFNRGKSDLKGVEFGAFRVPVVASDVAPYRRWIRHEENGFLAKKNKTKFWFRYIDKLLADKSLRVRMGMEAKKDAIKRDIKNNISDWIEVYNNV